MFKVLKISNLFTSIVLGLLLTSGCQQDDAEKLNETEQPQQEQMSEISDEELQQFVAASQQIQTMNQQVQQQMVSAVQEGGLGVERFNEIQQSEQDPNQELDASNDEMKQYQESVERLKQIQVDAQQEMQAMIQEEGLTLERYQQIGSALQTNPEIQEKLRTMQSQN